MKIYIYIFLSIIFLHSCKHENIGKFTIVNGQVVSDYDGTPVPYAKVFLIKEGRGCLGNMGCAKQVDYIQANEEGKFSFSFEWEGEDFYSVAATDNWYLNSNPVPLWNKGKENIPLVKLTPFGITPIHIKNIKNDPRIQLITADFISQQFVAKDLDTMLFEASPVLKGRSYSTSFWIHFNNGQDSSFKITYETPPPLQTATKTVEIFF
ncbi:MAG: hypothetical protein HYZ42_15870 [Bacteroidetes bacterium]|nr:hypothetical protein [Bacteroidota bacterium]